jgi:hypothetical protein
MAQHYKDLVVWQKAMDLVTEIYKATDSFPKEEVYSLTDQIRRAPFQCLAISQRGRLITAIENFCIFSDTQRGHSLKSKLSCLLRSGSDTSIIPRPRH